MKILFYLFFENLILFVTNNWRLLDQFKNNSRIQRICSLWTRTDEEHNSWLESRIGEERIRIRILIPRNDIPISASLFFLLLNFEMLSFNYISIHFTNGLFCFINCAKANKTKATTFFCFVIKIDLDVITCCWKYFCTKDGTKR